MLNADDILIDLDDMGVNSSPTASGEPSSRKIVLHRVTDSPKGMHLTLRMPDFVGPLLPRVIGTKPFNLPVMVNTSTDV